jgi:sulfide dehydrogenase [flavocytochrome c] flavoprotein subunit
VAVEPVTRSVRLRTRETLEYDRLVVAPGIDLEHGSIAGYGEQAAEIMPHACKAGAQTRLPKRLLEAMPDGGLVVIAAPRRALPLPARTL